MRDPTTSPWKDSTLGVQCTPDCPSDLALDELHVGEKKPAEMKLLKEHIVACTSCEARWNLREQGFSAFPQLNRDAMVARLHQLSAQIEVAQPPSFWKKVRSVVAQPAGFGTSMALVAAMFMLVIPLPAPETDSGTPDIRMKGTSFTVFRSTQDAVEILADGGAVHPGDKLRFKIEPREGTEVMVFGQETSGKLYVAFPLDGSQSSKPSTDSDQGVLPGAIALDESAGREKLYLVSCRERFGLADVQATGDKLRVPSGCETTAFEINKVSP